MRRALSSVIIIPVYRTRGSFVQGCNAVPVLYAGVNERTPRIHIVRRELLFFERFVEVIADPILYCGRH